MKLIITFFVFILFVNCKHKEENEKILYEQNQEIKNNTVKVEENILKNFTYEDIARFTIASVMGQPIKIVKATKNNDLYFVTYLRKSDKQKFEYKVKFDGNDVIWASIEGRWRNSKYDEKISFEENGEKLKIITTFSDMSQDIQEYKKGE
ncbi:hypothetical protein [Flavobacterium sp. LB2P53]|uniref:hypothetical protein n=1 Tax=Flavobacterium sp. LB2P53 TaxID=2497481 RepID=UPI000F816B25|nr:hypothetical protein [Flavobacterium sp. LB2P53]RTY68364.1 hypothetical protein EKL95_08770 [Flavobacterium sp. LB2P53]